MEENFIRKKILCNNDEELAHLRDAHPELRAAYIILLEVLI